MYPIVQKHPFGCGVACLAFITGDSYSTVCSKLGEHKAASVGFLCKELQSYLLESGVQYDCKYLKPPLKRKIYKNGTIVFLKRSKQFPTGHYLARSSGKW